MSLDTALKKDLSESEKRLQNLKWFHPEINRKNAEARMKSKLKKNGIFLVRENQTVSGHYILSFTFDKKVAHFKITESRKLYFKIENGPLQKGLDQLIEYYCDHCHNLPTKLDKPVKGGELPPDLSISLGYTNLLHIAISKEDIEKAKAIIQSKKCPRLTMKNERGSTALHLAAAKGFEEIVQLVIDKANVEAIDGDGYTALHLACAKDKAGVIKILIESGNADVECRHYDSGNLPLHEAARRGHKKCIEVLLQHGACAWPRNNEKMTPYELANQLKFIQCCEYIDNYVPPLAKTFTADWLHDSIDRHAALAFIEYNKIKDGLFLVRKSSRHEGNYVLTFSFNRHDYHFEIKNVSNKVYSLDSGPLFSSLEHLVEYYCLHSDGLSCKLSLAIKPSGEVLELILNKQMEELYMNRNMVPTVTESGFTEYSMAPGFTARHGSVSSNLSTGSDDYQFVSNVKRADTIFQKTALRGHILEEGSIEIGYELGQGEFGEVMKGTWTSPEGKKIDVALKTLRDEYLSSGKDSFLKEAEIMVKLKHPCIVNLIGVSKGPPIMLVQELVQLGSVMDFLLDYPEKIDASRDLYLWAAQVASGMLYLETQHFVHRDLAARNLLLQSKEQVKVGDFGLSRAVSAGESCYSATTGGRWPVRWYAPESMNFGKFSHASDVWSYGVTLWEMFTFGEQPYDDKTGAQVSEFVENKGRLEIPKDCPPKTYDIMLKCWEYRPEDRMTFKELLDYFNVRAKSNI